MPTSEQPLPDGLSIGPMRTGSTWLYEYLGARGDVCLPRDVKETFYFAENHDKGEAWYADHFRDYDPERHRKVIEVSPTLFQNPDAAARVARALGHPALLVTLRRPMDRAWSHYMHLRQHGKTTLDFDAAVRKLPAIVDSSLYAKHLTRWLDAFGRKSVHITCYNDLKLHRARYVWQVDLAFGLPPAPPQAVPTQKVNASSLPRNLLLARISRRAVARLHRSGLHRLVNAGKRIGLPDLVYGRSGGAPPGQNMRADTRRYLVERFAPDVADLERLLDVNLDGWRERWVAPRTQSRSA